MEHDSHLGVKNNLHLSLLSRVQCRKDLGKENLDSSWRERRKKKASFGNGCLDLMQELFWGECLLLVPAYDSVSKATLQIRSPSKLSTTQNSSLQVFLPLPSKAGALVLFCVFTSQPLRAEPSSWEMSPRPYLSSKYFSPAQCLHKPPFLPPRRK